MTNAGSVSLTFAFALFVLPRSTDAACVFRALDDSPPWIEGGREIQNCRPFLDSSDVFAFQ